MHLVRRHARTLVTVVLLGAAATLGACARVQGTSGPRDANAVGEPTYDVIRHARIVDGLVHSHASSRDMSSGRSGSPPACGSCS
jgi:hypothetical protein